MKQALTAKSVLTVRHDQAIDYDERRGIWVYRKGEPEEVGNILTNLGRVAIHTFIYGTASQKASAGLGVGLNYIGLSDDSAPPEAADSSLTAELTGDGLERALGAVTLPVGSGTITSIEHTFTYSGGPPQGVQKTALFDASSGGSMAHEILFSQRVLSVNDTLTLTFNITVT